MAGGDGRSDGTLASTLRQAEKGTGMDDREYEVKKAELTLKEREVAAKEKESSAPWWKNALTLSLLGTTLAVVVNIVTTGLNNRASAEAEHVRAQSNLLASVIRTNGNTVDSCSNLIFVVSIKLLDDPDGFIQRVCGTKGGIPTLPASSSGAVEGSGGYGVGGLWFGTIAKLTVRVDDADSHQPIADANVSLEQPLLASSFLLQQTTPILGQPQESKVAQPTTTNSTGEAVLSFVSSGDNLSVSKAGYESVTKPISQFGLAAPRSATVIVDLRRVPTSKH
jgi:hypothetical protein